MKRLLLVLCTAVSLMAASACSDDGNGASGAATSSSGDASTTARAVDIVIVGLTTEARADFRSPREARCVAETIVEDFGLERLGQLGLDLDREVPPTLEIPGLHDDERAQVGAAYDACLDSMQRDIEGFMADGLSEPEARCVSASYRASGIPETHLTEPPHGVSTVDTEEARASLDTFLEAAKLACRLWR
jgi:hypothetical protein